MLFKKKKKEGKTKERRKRKRKQPKIIKEEKKGWENCKKRFQTQITKYLKKPKLKLKIRVNLKIIKVPRNI